MLLPFHEMSNPLFEFQVGWRLTNWMTFNSAMHICYFAFLRFSSTTCLRIYNKCNIFVSQV